MDDSLDAGTDAIDVFDLLSDELRRDAIRRLRAVETPMALADLAADIATRKTGRAPSDVPDETVRRVYLALYHAHVPKLAEAGVVSYDREAKTVALPERSERLEECLQLLDAA